MTGPSDLLSEMYRLSGLIDNGVKALIEASSNYAHAEDAYRAAKARVFLSLHDMTVAEKEARVDQACSTERLTRNLAEGQRLAALEALRSRRQQLSALQTVANAVKAELDLARTGPEVAA